MRDLNRAPKNIQQLKYAHSKTTHNLQTNNMNIVMHVNPEYKYHVPTPMIFHRALVHPKLPHIYPRTRFLVELPPGMSLKGL